MGNINTVCFCLYRNNTRVQYNIHERFYLAGLVCSIQGEQNMSSVHPESWSKCLDLKVNNAVKCLCLKKIIHVMNLTLSLHDRAPPPHTHTHTHSPAHSITRQNIPLNGDTARSFNLSFDHMFPMPTMYPQQVRGWEKNWLYMQKTQIAHMFHWVSKLSIISLRQAFAYSWQ